MLGSMSNGAYVVCGWRGLGAVSVPVTLQPRVLQGHDEPFLEQWHLKLHQNTSQWMPPSCVQYTASSTCVFKCLNSHTQGLDGLFWSSGTRIHTRTPACGHS
jgi:hypothetical protein